MKLVLLACTLQAIADERYRFCDVVVAWPGSTHDSRIWRNSGIRDDFENRECIRPSQSPIVKKKECSHVMFLFSNRQA